MLKAAVGGDANRYVRVASGPNRHVRIPAVTAHFAPVTERTGTLQNWCCWHLGAGAGIGVCGTARGSRGLTRTGTSGALLTPGRQLARPGIEPGPAARPGSGRGGAGRFDTMELVVAAAMGDPPPAGAIEAAIAALGRGEVVGIPTDTVYGLAVDPSRAGAVDRLFAAKQRPRAVELPVLVADEAQGLALASEVPPAARALMARWWPGPLTLVLRRRPGLELDLGEDPLSIGLRCPDHPVPRAICTRLGPIATTSANRHGEPPSSTAGALGATMGGSVGLILDGGICAGAASTVVDFRSPTPRLLREGQLPWTRIQADLE